MNTPNPTPSPIIGYATTKPLNTPLGLIPSETFPIVQILKTPEGPIYVSQTEADPRPQLLAFSSILSFTPKE